MMRREVSGAGIVMPVFDCSMRRQSIVVRAISDADSYSLL